MQYFAQQFYDMLIVKLLSQLGMNSIQIDIYLKCLEYTKSSASMIASSLGRERTSTLKMMQSMEKAGYLSQSKGGITTYFHPIPFEVLYKQFEQQTQESTVLIGQKELMLNEINTLTNKSPDISCKLQDGINAVRYMYQTIISIIHHQNLLHISCIANNTFEAKSSLHPEVHLLTKEFIEIVHNKHVYIQSYLGEGMSLMEQLTISNDISQIIDYPNSNNTSQLWIVGSDIFIIIFKKNPQVVHLHNDSLANLMHFVIGQLDKVQTQLQ
ncbi:MAG TPA: helix-turn-helix domain-containing protein [Candidatus Absconditabacterales bacterium]|nr:helix-turn-helix domain-containing protein [Candidatus Absconditabacterales bacterium]